LANLFSKDASLHEVARDEEALEYHIKRFEQGYRYPLAKACYHYKQMRDKDASNSRD
jgi:hypothetical protein